MLAAVLEGRTIYPAKSGQDSRPLILKEDFAGQFRLSSRETEIIQLIRKGLTSKQIGVQLNLSELTVETHRKNIFRKLDVRSVAMLIAFANKNIG